MPYLCNPVSPSTGFNAEIAQLVEHDLAKVGVASSSLVFRSKRVTHLMRHPNFLYIIHYICATMKHFSILSIMALALILFTGCGVTKQTPEEKRAEEERVARVVKDNLDKRSYKIDVNYMIPTRWAASEVRGYYIIVDSTVIKSKLPYAGIAHSVAIEKSKGLTFTDNILEYHDSGRTANGRHISITVKTNEDLYDYKLIVFDDGIVDIHVHCRKLSGISYRGEVNTR